MPLVEVVVEVVEEEVPGEEKAIVRVEENGPAIISMEDFILSAELQKKYHQLRLQLVKELVLGAS